jgi:hypothetical protein
MLPTPSRSAKDLAAELPQNNTIMCSIPCHLACRIGRSKVEVLVDVPVPQIVEEAEVQETDSEWLIFWDLRV